MGDWVLVFPILRALRGPTVAVTAWSKAELAAALFDHVVPMDIERREFSRLYASGGPTTISPAVKQRFDEATIVISYLSDGCNLWAQNLRRIVPQAQHLFVAPQPPAEWTHHITQWHTEQLRRQGLTIEQVEVPLRHNADGPVVVHPGSGSVSKCWPRDDFAHVIEMLRKEEPEVRVILGEVELETWPRDLVKDWTRRFGAEHIDDLDQLWSILAQARLYVGNDSGPTHLAAQLGLPTLALFGPTQPHLWAPTGPAVQVLAPPQPQPMTWLAPARVLAAYHEMSSNR